MRLLTVAWTARRSNQSMLKEINPEYSLEGLMLKLKLQHSGHFMWRAYSLEKTLMLGKIEGRRRGQQKMVSASVTQWTWIWANSRRQWRTGKPGVLQSMGSQIGGLDLVTEHHHQQRTKFYTFLNPTDTYYSAIHRGHSYSFRYYSWNKPPQTEWHFKKQPFFYAHRFCSTACVCSGTSGSLTCVVAVASSVRTSARNLHVAFHGAAWAPFQPGCWISKSG